MDTFLASVCIELRNALQAWEVLIAKEDATRAELAQLRLKINRLCDQLDEQDGR